MRALIIVPLVIAAVIAVSRLLTLVTGDVMSAVIIELIISVTLVAVFFREPSHTERVMKGVETDRYATRF